MLISDLVPLIPLLWETPVNITLNNSLPTIFLLNTTNIPGVVDPFLLSVLSGPDGENNHITVQTVTDNYMTVTINSDATVGSSIPLITGSHLVRVCSCLFIVNQTN